VDALEIKERPRLQRYDRANTGGCGPQDHCTAVALEDSTEEEGTSKDGAHDRRDVGKRSVSLSFSHRSGGDPVGLVSFVSLALFL